MVLKGAENVDNQFIWDILETLAEVADASIRMFLEHFEFWILLVQFVGERPTNDVCEYALNSLLVALIILNGQDNTLVSALFPLQVCFLPHNSDGLIGGLHCNCLDVSDCYTVDSLNLGL